MTKFFYLIRTAFTKNPLDTWSVATSTSAERVALFVIGAFLVADVLAFNLIDMILDGALIVLVYLYIWDEVEITVGDEDEDA